MSHEWYISDDDGIEATIRDRHDPTEDGDGVVCRCTPGDAALIVNAVNCRDELLRCLNALVACQGEEGAVFNMRYDKACCFARDAIEHASAYSRFFHIGEKR